MKIHNWEELHAAKLENENYKVELGKVCGEYCHGWLNYKDENDKKCFEKSTCLTTHTFYGGYTTEYVSKKLKEAGFDVELVPWEV